jgi:hypothetical protein
MLQTVIRQHTGAILSAFKSQLQQDKTGEFSSPGVVSFITDGAYASTIACSPNLIDIYQIPLKLYEFICVLMK